MVTLLPDHEDDHDQDDDDQGVRTYLAKFLTKNLNKKPESR